MNERLQKQMNFILEIDKEKNVFRQTHLTNHGEMRMTQNMHGTWLS